MRIFLVLSIKQIYVLSCRFDIIFEWELNAHVSFNVGKCSKNNFKYVPEQLILLNRTNLNVNGAGI